MIVEIRLIPETRSIILAIDHQKEVLSVRRFDFRVEGVGDPEDSHSLRKASIEESEDGAWVSFEEHERVITSLREELEEAKAERDRAEATTAKVEQDCTEAARLLLERTDERDSAERRLEEARERLERAELAWSERRQEVGELERRLVEARDALGKIAERRNDPAFRARLERSIEENRELLDRLAAPTPGSTDGGERS